MFRSRPKIYHFDAWSSKSYNANDLSVLATDMISRMGKFHKLLIILLSVNHLIVSINHLVATFHSFVPKFYCRDNNETACESECQEGYVFLDEYETIATEFSLVCSKRFVAPLVNSLYFSGVLVGALLSGTLADIFGRKRIILICLYVQGILGASLYFIYNLHVIAVVRTIQGIFVEGLQGVSFVLLLEHAPAAKRTGPGVIFKMAWSVGRLYLAIASYFSPNFHILHLFLTIPTVLSITYTWLIPESITWLMTHEKYDDAYKLVVTMAKRNNDRKFDEELQSLKLTSNRRATSNSNRDSTEKKQVVAPKIKDLLRHRILRKHSLIMGLNFFAVPFCSWGIAFFLPNLAGDRHLNFAIGGIVEMISYSVSFIIFSRFGARRPLAACQYVIGALITGIVILSVAYEGDGIIEGHWSRSVTTALVLLTKAFSAASFCSMFILVVEVFPTGCRAAAMGLCGAIMRFATLLSPQLDVIGELTFITLPITIMGVLGIIAGTAVLLLPETLGIVLPNSLDDVNELWGKRP